MTDEIAAVIPDPALSGAAAVVASVAQEPSPPLSPSAEPPATVPAASAEPAPAEPVVPATEASPAAPAEPQREPTIIEKFIAERDAKKVADEAAAKSTDPANPADPAKPAEAVPADPAKAADPAPSADPVTAEAAAFDPVTHEFELPPTIQGKSPQMDEFRGILGERDTMAPGAFAQRLVDLHAKSMQEFADTYAKDLSAKQWQVWNDGQKALEAEVMADSIIGGSNFGGAMERIAKFRDTFVPAEEIQAFDTELRLSGAGNMVHILRAMYRAQSRFDEPAMPPTNPKPPRDIGQRPGARRLRDGYTTNGR